MNQNDDAVGLALSLWRCFAERRWDDAKQLLSPDFEATWPQSRERIVGPDNFIGLNRDYPGTHEFQIVNHQYGFERWERGHHVTTQVLIKSSMPDGKRLELYAISFFAIQDHKIRSAVEYWAETYLAPEWRRNYVQAY